MRIATIILFFLPLTAFAQTTFAPIGAKWTYMQYNFIGMPEDSTIVTLEYVGDTIIQGRTCSTLELSGIQGCMDHYEHLTVSGDTVLFHDHVEDVFRILYIMGASVGTSWATIISMQGWEMGDIVFYRDTMIFSVTASDTVIIAGMELRRSFIDGISIAEEGFAHYPIQGQIIERLGHSFFLYPWTALQCDWYSIGPLRCYEDPDIEWMNPQFPQCDLTVWMREIDPFIASIVPTLLTVGEPVQIIPASSGAIDYMVYDVIGKLLHAGNSNGPLTFRLEHAGLYHVLVWQGTERPQHHRVMVQ